MGIESTPGPEFLKTKYNLHTSSEVERAALRKEQRTGEKVSQNPKDRIQNYLDRLKGIIDPPELKGHEGFDRKERNLAMLRRALYKKCVIKPENISQGYVKNILLGNYAEQKGYDREKLKLPDINDYVLKMFKEETQTDFNDFQVPQDQREQVVTLAVKDQETSLDRWFDYLTAEEAENYPDEFRYWAFAEVLKLGAQDKERKDFNKRREDTASPYPELNQQALALVLDEITRKYQQEPSQINLNDEEKQTDYKKRLQSENFGKLYGWALEYVNSLKLPEDRLPVTIGQWREFPKGSDPKILADTLSGFNTGWCISGVGTAENYLSHSNVSIYYSQDAENQNTIPRAAIVSNGERVTEVRGIIQTEKVKQHLDDYITPVVSEKLKGLNGGKEWETGMADMKQLAEIHFKYLQNEKLTKDDLVFLYEINRQIQSLGYGKDPRITEIRSQRNPKEDAPIVFECNPQDIAWNPDQISQTTKAYIGQLFPGIFSRLSNTENIYTSFPEGKISQSELMMGGLDKDQLQLKLNELCRRTSGEVNISQFAQDKLNDIYNSPEFIHHIQNPEKINLVRLKVRDLGFPNGATIQEIYDKAKELGLELCPDELGPYQRINDTEQSLDNWYLIAMKQFADRDGHPYVFNLVRNDYGLWLHCWAEPDSRWSADYEFVFRLRKDSQES